MVLRYEKRFDSSRQPIKQHSLDKIIIAENGPLLNHADERLERAMNQYWRVANRDGKWHFLRRTKDTHSYTGNCSSRVVVGKVVGEVVEPTSVRPT